MKRIFLHGPLWNRFFLWLVFLALQIFYNTPDQSLVYVPECFQRLEHVINKISGRNFYPLNNEQCLETQMETRKFVMFLENIQQQGYTFPQYE